MRKTRKTVAITGASSGLGAALARLYAGDGARLFLCARRKELLEQVAINCRTLGASVDCATVDVRTPEQVEGWVAAITARAPVDLVIVNSGQFHGNPAPDQLESAASAADVVATNLSGAIATASAFSRVMQEQRSGRIALISSLAALAPQADAPAYSASKAGISTYGSALREYLAPFGVGVSIVQPGHIDTAQTSAQVGPLPGLMSPEIAAGKIKRGLDQSRAEMSFPAWLHMLIVLENMLPRQLRARINHWFRFTVEK